MRKDSRHEFRLDARYDVAFEEQLEGQNITKQDLLEGWVKEWLKAPAYVPAPAFDPTKIDLRNMNRTKRR